MKTKSSKLIIAGVASIFAAPAFALDAPADNAPPPASAQVRGQQEPASLPEFKLPPARTDAKKAGEEAPFLGIVSGEVPPCLADHVGLKDDQGVIVRAVVPDSPAGKAGIAVNDVITAVGGESVGSPSDVTDRILAHKPGEAVTLDVIHKGTASKLDVTLVSRPRDIVPMEPQGMDMQALESLPKEMAERIRRELDKKSGPLDLKLEDLSAMPRQMEDAMREMQDRMRDAMRLNGLPEDGEVAAPQAEKPQAQSAATFRMQDNEGSIELKSSNGSKELTLRDHDGNTLWSGPWNTEADKSAAPRDAQRRVEGLGIDNDFKGNGIRFRSNPAVPKD